MSETKIGLDLEDGYFFVAPETLRDIANRLEAGERPEVPVMEFASDKYLATFRPMPPGGFDDPDKED